MFCCVSFFFPYNAAVGWGVQNKFFASRNLIKSGARFIYLFTGFKINIPEHNNYIITTTFKLSVQYKPG